ncbi:hypothetical protein BDB01DRAFT_798761 [Pilobolus umbonatus]|nr:hypothetical protein BDB01DRAFT_798761 [Pilobolus umbonatus]
MDRTHQLEQDDPNSLTSFNIISEVDGEGLISKIFSKLKTAVSAHSTSPSSSSYQSISRLSTESLLETATYRTDSNGILAQSIAESTTKLSDPIVSGTAISKKNDKNSFTSKLSVKQPINISMKGKSYQNEDKVEPGNNYTANINIPLRKTSSCDSDTQSVMTTFSVSNTNSLVRILNRLRGETDTNTEFWTPDDQCDECSDCNAPFNLFRRKHHCRTCGRIFCSKCLTNNLQAKQQLRVCNECFMKNERFRMDDAMSIHDCYPYSSVDINSLANLSPAPQKTFLTSNISNKNDYYNSCSDDEFERATSSFEIQRPSIDLHFSQSTSSHQTVTDHKKLLPNSFLRPPRSRTSTMNSLGIDTSLSILEGRQHQHHHLHHQQQQQQQQQLNSPMPFRRNSTIEGNSGVNNAMLQNEYYEGDDDDSRRWDKTFSTHTLNFLGGGNNGERPTSGIFTGNFLDDYANSSSGNETPTTSTSTNQNTFNNMTTSNSTRNSWILRSTNADRSNGIRRRLSLTDSTNATNMMVGNGNVLSGVNGNSSMKHVRVRTKSLMRNTPITTASIMKDNVVESATDSDDNSAYYQNGSLQPSNSTSTVHATAVRSITPEIEHLNSQIMAYNGHATVATHQQWDESFIHLVRNILRYLLEAESEKPIKNIKAWENIIMELLLKIVDEVQPHIRVSETFNLSHYVKIKKVPGGLPKDSFSISGIVLSKSVAHKDMVKRIKDPLIMILNFELDTGKDAETPSQYIKLENASDTKRIEDFIANIVRLKPSIVLVANGAPRIFIEALNKAKIVVAYQIKKHKLDAISRCTNTSIFNFPVDLSRGKVDHLGKCKVFETLTIMHKWLPNRRKTFLLFRGCPKERGATIVLRGDTMKTLTVIKYIMNFMVQVVNNINLEAQLRKEFIELRRWHVSPEDFEEITNYFDKSNQNMYRHDDDNSTLQHQRVGTKAVSSFRDGASVDLMQTDTRSISAISVAESQLTANTSEAGLMKKRSHHHQLKQQPLIDLMIVEDDDICLTAINNVLKRYQNTILSVSPGVTLPVPHLLLKLRESQKKLIGLIRERLGASITGQTLATDEYENGTVFASLNVNTNSNNEKTKPPIPPIPIELSHMIVYLKAFDFYLENDLEYRYYQEQHCKCWYEFRKCVNIGQKLSPIYHQTICVHRTINPLDNHTLPCEKVVLESYSYYEPGYDYPIIHYILNAVNEAYSRCNSKMCGLQYIYHERTFSHGNAQIKVQLDHITDATLNGDEEPEDRIEMGKDEQLSNIPLLMSTQCKFCDVDNPYRPVSELFQRYSFGKFLELLFYQSEPIPLYSEEEEGLGDNNQFIGCPHGLYRDHTFFFRIKNYTVSFTHNVVKVVDVIKPPLHLRVSYKKLIAIKDAALENTRTKIAKFFDSIIERNKGFSFDIVQPSMVDTCKEHLQEMSQEALKNKKSLLQKLQSEYATSAPTDTLQLNNVLAELQNHAVTWDLKYVDFARRFVRPERELRRLTTNHLRKMFPAESLYNNNNTAIVSNLNLRTKRAIEAADLPLLDVGLGDISMAQQGVSGNGPQDIVTSSSALDLSLKDQPVLGESPTSSYPWHDEEKRFDQLFMQERDESGVTPITHQSNSSHISIHPTASINFKTKKSVDTESSNSLGGLRASSVDSDSSHTLDPSVARRLSLELMKDAPNKKKEMGHLHLSSLQPNAVTKSLATGSIDREDKDAQRYLQESRILEDKSDSVIGMDKMIRKRPFMRQEEDDDDDDDDDDDSNSMDELPLEAKVSAQSSRLIRHAAAIPIFQSNTIKRLAQFLPDPSAGKSKSTPSPVGSPQTRHDVEPYQHYMDNFRTMNRKSQLQNPYHLLASSNSSNIPTSKMKQPNQESKIQLYRSNTGNKSSQMNFYRGSPYASKIQDKSNTNYHYGYKGRIENSKSNRTIKESDFPKNRASGSGTHTSVNHTDSNKNNPSIPPRSRSRIINYVQGASVSTFNKPHERTRGGRIPVITLHGITSDKVRPTTSSGNNSVSHLPIPTSSHRRKLAEGVNKIRNIRERLPSKASLEAYTKIKEIELEESSSSDEDEFRVSDDSSSDEDDNSDDRLPFQHTTFSLIYTDEYDESLGREMVPSILELQQFNREHQLQMSNNTLPFLSVESGLTDTEKHSADLNHLDTAVSSMPIPGSLESSDLNNSSHTKFDWSTNSSGKNSIMKAITYVLAEKSITSMAPLEYPFSSTEHIFVDSKILVREDEPSSIISYILVSTFYNEKLKNMQEMRMNAWSRRADTTSTHSGSEKIHHELNEGDHEYFFDMFPETDERERPWRFAFQGGSTNFTCKIYFAEQFEMLRKHCGCDDLYISSLARCTTWDASGGKSGSIFLKTQDERFLIKQISKYEMDAFLGSANKYFVYLFDEVIDKELSTVLSKIFGVYRIGFYNNVTGKSMKMDIVVMENLFYETSIKKVYDLKGSMRNRYAEKTGKEVEVFLDENLVEAISKTPLYMRMEAKMNLSESLYNDTQFLLQLDVMDYSLLVGLDEERNEMIVGIVGNVFLIFLTITIDCLHYPY